MTPAAYAAIHLAGYAPVAGDIAIQCVHSPLETFTASTWDSLATFAMNYELCDCGKH